MSQLESFLREQHYNRAMELWRLLDEHPWSRRLSQRDAGAIAEAQRQAQILANGLYHLRKELMARLAAADEVAAAGLRQIAGNARLVLDSQPGAERKALEEIEFHAAAALRAYEATKGAE